MFESNVVPSYTVRVRRWPDQWQKRSQGREYGFDISDLYPDFIFVIFKKASKIKIFISAENPRFDNPSENQNHMTLT